MRNCIVLIGLPGCGKSTVGRQLAKRLNAAFQDTDAVITDRIGMPIRSFFEQEGEERFREIEHRVLAEFLDGGYQGVLATGGGIVLRDDNRECLRQARSVVYLRASPDDLVRRLRHDRQRPLLQVSDPLKRLRELYAVRDPLYRDVATFVIDTGRPSVSMLANLIATQLELDTASGRAC